MGQLKPALSPMMSYCSVIREVEDTEVLTSYSGVLESVQLKEVYLAFNPQFQRIWKPQDKERVLLAQAISNHSHSLLADHLLDITASDQHVVKAWFTGKLDYSPPVADLSEAGYKLAGGRLDMLENRPVAAIVYWHQDHVINEFVWPAGRRTVDFDVQSNQEYSMCAWNKSGFNYLIVADLSQANIEKFEDQIRERIE
jgi:anti-sigma factor RsiW